VELEYVFRTGGHTGRFPRRVEGVRWPSLGPELVGSMQRAALYRRRSWNALTDVQMLERAVAKVSALDA
jgi:hypothetical protein